MNLAAKVARRRDTNFGTHLLPWTFNSGITVTPFLTLNVSRQRRSACRPWILGRSATGSREADLSVFAKLFEDRLKWRLEAETFSRR